MLCSRSYVEQVVFATILVREFAMRYTKLTLNRTDLESMGHRLLLLAALLMKVDLDEEGVCDSIAIFGIIAFFNERIDRFDDRLLKIKRTMSFLNFKEAEESALAKVKEDTTHYDLFIEELRQQFFQKMDSEFREDVQTFFSNLKQYHDLQANFPPPLKKYAEILSSFDQSELEGLLFYLQTHLKTKAALYVGGTSNCPTENSFDIRCHAIAIGFDPEKQAWCYLDANLLPSVTVTDIKEMAREIMDLYQVDGHALLKIYPLGLADEKLEALFTNLQKEVMESFDPRKLTYLDSKGDSLLHSAILQELPSWVKKFLELGSQINIKNRLGLQTLELAIYIEHVEIVKELLAHGADPNSVDKNGCPVLSAAIYLGDEICDALLQRGADPDKENDGITPLQAAILSKRIAVAKKLLSHKANPNLIAQESGITPLHLAIIKELTVAFIRALLESGADPNLPDKLGNTALHCAVIQNSSREVWVALLEHGASLDIENLSGHTPLGVAEHDAHILLEHSVKYSKKH